MKANEVRMILAGMMAAGMVLGAVPAMAEETEVQTEAAAETEMQRLENEMKSKLLELSAK